MWGALRHLAEMLLEGHSMALEHEFDSSLCSLDCQLFVQNPPLSPATGPASWSELLSPCLCRTEKTPSSVRAA